MTQNIALADALMGIFGYKRVEMPPEPTRKPYKPKKCPVCQKLYIPAKSLQKACTWQCGVEWGRQKQEKQVRKEIREKRETLKRRADWIREAQEACNTYIRARDIAAGYGCIDCGKPFEPNRPGGSIDAGHFLSRSLAPHLRFDERNIHAQRKNCNRPGGTTRAAFKAGVIARYGVEVVEALENDNSAAKWTIPELQAIKATYKQKLKELKQKHNGG